MPRQDPGGGALANARYKILKIQVPVTQTRTPALMAGRKRGRPNHNATSHPSAPAPLFPSHPHAVFLVIFQTREETPQFPVWRSPVRDVTRQRVAQWLEVVLGFLNSQCCFLFLFLSPFVFLARLASKERLSFHDRRSTSIAQLREGMAQVASLVMPV